MDKAARLTQIETRIEKLKKALSKLGEMRPGSLSEQYNVCGSPGCRCKDPQEPKKHGPYWQLSYMHQGRSSSQFIRKEFLAATRRQLVNYKAFRELTDEWIRLALEHAKMKLEIGRER
jgi:hypothetical protein